MATTTVDVDTFEFIQGEASLSVFYINVGDSFAGSGTQEQTGLKATATVGRDLPQSYDLSGYDRISVFGKGGSPDYQFSLGGNSASPNSSYVLGMSLLTSGSAGESSMTRNISVGGDFEEVTFDLSTFSTGGGLDLSSVDGVEFSITSPNVSLSGSLASYLGFQFGFNLDYIRALT